MPFPPSDKTMEGVIRDTRERLDLVERRLAVGGSGSSTPYDAQPGMVMPFAGSILPTGWLLADGSLVSRTTYSKLFAVIGTTYGVGDGSTTFALPNYKGRTLVGKDGAQVEFDTLGETGGAKVHTLTIAEMPSHAHQFNAAGLNALNSMPSNWDDIVGAGAAPLGVGPANPEDTAANAIRPRGGGGAHNNLQPYSVANYIISTGEGTGGGGPIAQASSGDVSAVRPGMISPYAGAVAPTGWLICDGAAVSRSAYSALFSAIGTVYGAGDGSTTFNLPNLKGKAPFGRDTAQTEFDVLGETGGAKNHRHDFRVAMLDKNWGPAGVAGGLGNSSTTVKAGAFRYSTGQFMGGGDADSGTGTAQINTSVQNGTNTQQTVGRYDSTGDTELASGGATGGLPPYVVTNYIISIGTGSGNVVIPPMATGTVVPFAGSAVPVGWLLCDGAAVSRTAYATLFTAIGTTYGVGDGSTTFNVPNYKGRALVGMDSTQTEFNAMGKTGGEKAHLVTPAETPFAQTTEEAPGAGFGLNVAGSFANRVVVTRAAASGHNNLQPYAVANYIISTGPTGAPVADGTAIVGIATAGADMRTPATPTTFIVTNWSAFDGPAGMWSAASPGRFILNKPGKWRVMGKIRMLGASSGIAYMNIWKNGNTLPRSEDLRTIGSGGGYPQCHDIITSNGTDYIEFRATNSNNDQQVASSNQLVTLEWIGA